MESLMPGAPGSAPVAQGHYSFQDLIRLWQQAGGSAASAPSAAAIAMAESGGRSVMQQGQSPATTGWGLWQITPGSSALLNPMANATAAVAKWKAAGGFSPWTTYNTGAYQQFLGTAKGAAASDNSTPLTGISIPNPADAITGAFSGLWNGIVSDAKYAAVLVAVLALGVFLIVHGLSGVASGGNQQRSYVPVPV